jgi:hypothetical protein
MIRSQVKGLLRHLRSGSVVDEVEDYRSAHFRGTEHAASGDTCDRVARDDVVLGDIRDGGSRRLCPDPTKATT